MFSSVTPASNALQSQSAVLSALRTNCRQHARTRFSSALQCPLERRRKGLIGCDQLLTFGGSIGWSDSWAGLAVVIMLQSGDCSYRLRTPALVSGCCLGCCRSRPPTSAAVSTPPHKVSDHLTGGHILPIQLRAASLISRHSEQTKGPAQRFPPRSIGLPNLWAASQSKSLSTRQTLGRRMADVSR